MFNSENEKVSVCIHVLDKPVKERLSSCLSKIQHIARHYDILLSTIFSITNSTGNLIELIRISDELSYQAESHVGISSRPKKSSNFRPGTKVRDEIRPSLASLTSFHILSL